MEEKNNIVIYQLEDGKTKIDVKLEDETVSHNKAIEKAKDEYKKYQVKTITPVEKEYLETLKVISNKIDDKQKMKKDIYNK